MKVLIIEDDTDIARQLSDHLKECGFVPHVENSGEEGLYQGEVEEYDAVLLDIGLPEIDGFSILEKWRSKGKNMPVIILSARTQKIDTIKGLKAGADDYIYKPFDMKEVEERLRANIRRYKGQFQQIINYGNIVFDTNLGRFSVNDCYIKLTRIEFLILQYLFISQGKVISVPELSEHIYDDFDNDSSIIAKHIANIRKKVGNETILTEGNRGYYVPKDDK